MSLEQLAKEFFTSYGPLGLGWIVAAILFMKFEKRTDQFISIIQVNAEAANKVAGNLKELQNVIQAVAGRPVNIPGIFPGAQGGNG